MEILFTTNEQNWLETRKGKFTASEIHKLMGGSRSGGLLSQTAETYVYEKCAELLTGEIKNTYAPALDWGKEYELEAFNCFSKNSFESMSYYGGENYVFIPYGIYSGYSPDGLSDKSILEIKCPYNSGNHLKNFSINDAESLKKIRPEYYWQMQLGMIAANLDNGYFVSFDPRMPDNKQLHIAEIERHEVQGEIDEKLEAAWGLLQSILH